MKTKFFFIAFLTAFGLTAQERTTVTANSHDISQNLDLRAVASIFGQANDLQDFERRLNDPATKISNLDLNGDNVVDYLRVIESVKKNTHLIIIQSILGRDQFQDVATIEVERDRRNRVQVQVVGNSFMYGSNYIYEPVYYQTPIIYNYFWVNHYRPYYSSWTWGYYPTYYYGWSPFPMYAYYSNVNYYININHQYNYCNTRRSQRAIAMYDGRRQTYYENQYPNQSFEVRNRGIVNRYELDRTTRTNSQNNGTVRPNTSTTNTSSYNGGTRSYTVSSNTNYGGIRSYGNNAEVSQNTIANQPQANYGGIRNNNIGSVRTPAAIGDDTPTRGEQAQSTTGGIRTNQLTSPGGIRTSAIEHTPNVTANTLNPTYGGVRPTRAQSESAIKTTPYGVSSSEYRAVPNRNAARAMHGENRQREMSRNRSDRGDGNQMQVRR